MSAGRLWLATPRDDPGAAGLGSWLRTLESATATPDIFRGET
jgi:hypothetical protein